jgi:hypothetical protein
MNRPRGVTVLACLYLFVAIAMLIALIPSQAFRPLQHPGLLAQSLVYFVVSVTLSVALLKMRNWSGWLAITFSAVQLLSVLYIVVANSPVSIGRLGLRVLFAVWVIWYLTRPHVRAAFQRG